MMVKKKKKRYKNKKLIKRKRRFSRFLLSEETKKYILGIFFFLLTIIFALSFFEKAGVAGRYLFKLFYFLIGNVVFILPLILVLAGLIFFFTKYQKIFIPLILAIFSLILSISGILENLAPGSKYGGLLGYIFSWPLLKLFGFWVTQIIFLGVILAGVLIFWHLLRQPAPKEPTPEAEKKPSLIRKIFTPSFKIKEVEPEIKKIPPKTETPPFELKTKEIPHREIVSKYQMPPLELLDSKKSQPLAGDTRINSTIIKKTLESFEIPVEMSEVNIGPTVTQYTLKPADGIKLSKITSLSNDLALALASHPIRIEAPIPGKSLVGVEVPNRVRAPVHLRGLIQNPKFQNSPSNLTFCLGKNVSGNPIYDNLAKMPHLLVAGSTGTGKTIFLNNLILSLLYRNSPEILRFVLIDPKRVEFSIYNGLPHLLCPVVVNVQKTVNALKWLIEEMERRFEILAEMKTKSIAGYNEQAFKSKTNPLPYIILIVDELADLMAAKGREVEAGIVRLAQMSRAVGIHLVVATQRPSVEVITGLIKANITSRVTFQVASQVDSRTVLDMAGAEKLLGLGDMLFISAENVKPKRIQGAYISEKEVKKVVGWIKSKVRPDIDQAQESKIEQEILKNALSEDLRRTLEVSETEFEGRSFEEDPLYEEAKRVVVQARKASASLLQRKLRIGYARAARLIDVLEERGVVGPSQGAKPREVFIKTDEENEGWQKI
ncbi:MAG: DNA translocase FtsK [Candidatus Paceibacterales bacterium]